MNLNNQYTYNNFLFFKDLIRESHRCEYCKSYSEQKITYITFELFRDTDEVFVYFYCDNHYPYKNSQTENFTGYLYEIIKFYKAPFNYDEIFKFAKTLSLLE